MAILAFLLLPQLVCGGITGIMTITGNVFHAPVARFTADIPEGPAPHVVQFMDQSDSDPVTWLWDFGDGTNSTEMNPAHTYANGRYTVNLTVTNSGGTSTKIAENYISTYASKQALAYGTTKGLTGTGVAVFNISGFTADGGTHTLSGNTLTLTNPAGSAFRQMTITLDTVDTSNGNITGPVNSILLESTPQTGTLSGTGESERHTLRLWLNAIPPPGAEIRTTIIEGTDRESQDKLQAFAASNGLELVDTRYELVVSTDIPYSTITNAEIVMEVPASWYNTYSSKIVRILRIDNGGSVSMLGTTFSGFSGPYAIVNGRSPYGLSTFSITALQGPAGPATTASSPGTGSGDSGGGDSGSDRGGSPAGSTGSGTAAENSPGEPSQKSPPVPDFVPSTGQGTGQLAPAEGSLVSQTIDLSPYSRLLSTDSSGRLYAVIDRGEMEQAGTGISVVGKTIRITRPEFTLRIIGGTMTEVNGIIRAGPVQTILLAATPMEAQVQEIGPVTSSFTAGLASIPAGARITTTLAEPVNPVVAELFRNAVVHEGDEIQAVAYTLTVQKNNISATLPATITMSAPAAWVTAHGGTKSVVIGRIADNQTCTILKTAFSGNDSNGNMVFVADSPEGLSVFGLIAAKGPLQTRAGHPIFMTLVLQNPVLSAMLGMMNGITGTLGELGLVLLGILIVVLIVGGTIWRDRKQQNKRPSLPEKK
jgi:PKD repeat protein